MQINNRVLITGASQGIGRAIAIRATHDGYRVINLDKKAPKSLLEGETYHPIDLMDPKAIEELIPRISKEEPIVRLVNNAGFIRPGALENTTLDDFEAVMALNLRAPMLLAQQLLPQMRQAKFGRIVSIASRAALGKEERTVYAASKAGLVGMTKTWALEMAPFGITVNAIGPGPIATELFTSGNPPGDPKTIKIIQNIPVQRMGQPEDVAHAVASLLDDRAGFITGQIHFVCGGMTVGLSNAS
ncbi:FabG Dehydrogenases with different specificities (related to short-chain alcohol dehydrogenases) [Burkholderiaceae bacterium]|jgi:NAD(P)-dependent dehydrogenase (short-subunit alcohol dehydrogenase family)